MTPRRNELMLSIYSYICYLGGPFVLHVSPDDLKQDVVMCLIISLHVYPRIEMRCIIFIRLLLPCLCIASLFKGTLSPVNKGNEADSQIFQSITPTSYKSNFSPFFFLKKKVNPPQSFTMVLHRSPTCSCSCTCNNWWTLMARKVHNYPRDLSVVVCSSPDNHLFI